MTLHVGAENPLVTESIRLTEAQLQQLHSDAVRAHESNVTDQLPVGYRLVPVGALNGCQRRGRLLSSTVGNRFISRKIGKKS